VIEIAANSLNRFNGFSMTPSKPFKRFCIFLVPEHGAEAAVLRRSLRVTEALGGIQCVVWGGFGRVAESADSLYFSSSFLPAFRLSKFKIALNTRK